MTTRKPAPDFDDIDGPDGPDPVIDATHKPATDVTTEAARTNARLAAEANRAKGNQGKDRKGVTRNAPDQTVHATQEHAAVHDENTDREADDLYTKDGENEVREWKRHSALDAPPARPGYVQRFIRVRLGVSRDAANWVAKQREGWRPVKLSSVTDRSLPTTALENGTEVIGVEDLVLCEMPEKIFEQRQAYYRQKLRDQNSAIERQLRETGAQAAGGFGAIEQTRRTSVSTRAPGRSQGRVAADD
jgi:hypothetical protein